MEKINKNHFNNPIVVILVLTLIGLGGYVLFSKSSDNNSPNPATTSIQLPQTDNQTIPTATVQAQPQNTTPQPPRYYTPMTFAPTAESQRSSFVNACMSHESWGICNCNFDYIINNYGVIWLINENAYININGAGSGEFRSEALDASKYCSVFSN